MSCGLIMRVFLLKNWWMLEIMISSESVHHNKYIKIYVYMCSDFTELWLRF